MAIETERATTVVGWMRIEEEEEEEDGGGLDSSRGTQEEGTREEVLRVIDCVLGVASGTGKVFKVPLQGLNGAQFSFRLLRKMDIENSYPAWLSQGDALVASLARRSRVRFFVVLNWNRKRAVSCFQSILEYVKFP